MCIDLDWGRITKSGREEKQLLIFLEKENIDIIVMGTHGRTGIAHVFFRDVAEKVPRLSPFPVLLISCKKKRELL